jgi:hypothetical protein
MLCIFVAMNQLALCCLLALFCTAASQFLPPRQLPCGGTVGSVAFDISRNIPNDVSNAIITFTTQSDLAHYDTVTVSYPPGYFVPNLPGQGPAEIGVAQRTPGAAPVFTIMFLCFFCSRSLTRKLVNA